MNEGSLKSIKRQRRMCTVSYKVGWLGLGLDGIRVRHRAPNGANEMNCEPSLRLSVCRRVLRDGRSDLLYPSGSYLSITIYHK